jgi:hypothetical protein
LPNKELKLTKPGTIGASQLNSSVRRIVEEGDRHTITPPPLVAGHPEEDSWTSIRIAAHSNPSTFAARGYQRTVVHKCAPQYVMRVRLLFMSLQRQFNGLERQSVCIAG